MNVNGQKKGHVMALTKDFKGTVIERARNDSKFRRCMLTRGIALLVAGNGEDVQIGKSFIRNYINATIGFPALAKRTRIPKESLMRMLGPSGNPALNNLNLVTHTLLENEGLKQADNLSVSVRG
jgi:hypothetical protein